VIQKPHDERVRQRRLARHLDDCCATGCQGRPKLLTDRIVYLYTIRVIKSFRHKGLNRFAESGSKAGIQPKHADRLRRLLTALDVASVSQDMDAPGNKLHRLEGDLAHHWAVSVSGNWRLTFSFDGEDVIFVDYQDYH